MSTGVSADQKAEAVALYLVWADLVSVADEYGVETSDVAGWLRAAGHPVPRGRLPQVRCKHGHRMMETRKRNNRGEWFCSECQRKRGREAALVRSAADRSARATSRDRVLAICSQLGGLADAAPSVDSDLIRGALAEVLLALGENRSPAVVSADEAILEALRAHAVDGLEGDSVHCRCPPPPNDPLASRWMTSGEHVHHVHEAALEAVAALSRVGSEPVN